MNKTCSCEYCVQERRRQTQQLLAAPPPLDAAALVVVFLLPVLAILGVIAAWGWHP